MKYLPNQIVLDKNGKQITQRQKNFLNLIDDFEKCLGAGALLGLKVIFEAIINKALKEQGQIDEHERN